MRPCTISLGKNTSSSSPSYNKLTFDQQRLVELLARDIGIRKKLISIQFMLLPYLEIIHRKLPIAQNLMKKDTHLSTHEGLVTLATNLEIQIKSLQVACDN